MPSKMILSFGRVSQRLNHVQARILQTRCFTREAQNDDSERSALHQINAADSANSLKGVFNITQALADKIILLRTKNNGTISNLEELLTIPRVSEATVDKMIRSHQKQKQKENKLSDCRPSQISNNLVKQCKSILGVKYSFSSLSYARIKPDGTVLHCGTADILPIYNSSKATYEHPLIYTKVSEALKNVPKADLIAMEANPRIFMKQDKKLKEKLVAMQIESMLIAIFNSINSQEDSPENRVFILPAALLNSRYNLKLDFDRLSAAEALLRICNESTFSLRSSSKPITKHGLSVEHYNYIFQQNLPGITRDQLALAIFVAHTFKDLLEAASLLNVPK